MIIRCIYYNQIFPPPIIQKLSCIRIYKMNYKTKNFRPKMDWDNDWVQKRYYGPDKAMKCPLFGSFKPCKPCDPPRPMKYESCKCNPCKCNPCKCDSYFCGSFLKSKPEPFVYYKNSKKDYRPSYLPSRSHCH